MSDLQAILFWIMATGTGFCALAVVVSQNIVRSATWLLFTLGGVSGLFFLLGADFVGATQLLVYVGGTLVLVVFGVMLTAQGPFITMKTRSAEWVVAAAVGCLLFSVLAVTALNASWPEPPRDERMTNPRNSPSSTRLGLAFFGFEEATAGARITGLPRNARPRQRKRVAYLLPFEIVSVHLLVVLLGAAYLARAKRRRGTPS
jgi:NADH:ubiquinone oxidoreductase subunit 6 (subunit J)